MYMLSYIPDLIIISVLFLTTLAIQGLIDGRYTRIHKNENNGLKANILKNRMKRILADDRAFEVRKNYKMAIRREPLNEPLFITSNFR
jgi:hypothetical protein